MRTPAIFTLDSCSIEFKDLENQCEYVIKFKPSENIQPVTEEFTKIFVQQIKFQLKSKSDIEIFSSAEIIQWRLLASQGIIVFLLNSNLKFQSTVIN